MAFMSHKQKTSSQASVKGQKTEEVSRELIFLGSELKIFQN
jgi:hypothetical protein